MKKFYFVWILMFLFVGTQVFAEVVTTRRRIQPQAETTQQQVTKNPEKTQSKIPKVGQYSNETKLSSSVKNCKKYSETLDSDVGGVNFNFKIAILGWQGNKCRIDFEANSTSISSLFSALYGVDPSMATIQTFEPKIQCGFTKQQLELVGESILEEESRANGGRMLKDPSKIEIPKVSELKGTDAALMNIILNEGACNILNAQDSNEMFNALFGY